MNTKAKYITPTCLVSGEYFEATLAYSKELNTTRMEITTGKHPNYKDQRVELDGDFVLGFHNFLCSIGYKLTVPEIDDNDSP